MRGFVAKAVWFLAPSLYIMVDDMAHMRGFVAQAVVVVSYAQPE